MSNFHQISFYNNQRISVFKNYKLFNNHETLLFNTKDSVLSDIPEFKRKKYFIQWIMPLEKDIKKLAEFEKLPYDEMYAILVNNGDLIYKDYEYQSTIFGLEKLNGLYNLKSYNLFDFQGLYTELAKIEPFNFKDINHFSKSFGLPTGEFGIGGSTYNVLLQATNFMELNLKLMNFRLVFEAFQNFVTQDIESIRNRMIKENEARLKFLIYDDKSNNVFPDYESKIKSAKNRIESLKKAKKDYLLKLESKNLSSFTLNKHIESTSEEHLRYHDGFFILERNFFSLFEFAYFQIARALSSRATLKKCEFCNHVFEETNEKMRFCPALPSRKRSSCEMAYNNRKHN